MVYIKKKKDKNVTYNIHCDFCEQVFGYNQLYLKHANAFHRHQISQKWVPCQQCPTFYPTAAILKSHCNKRHSVVLAEDKLKCDFCNVLAQTPRNLFKHCNEKHYDIIKGIWMACGECEKYYPNQKKINYHKNIAHPKIVKIGRYQCEFCPALLMRPGGYLHHGNSKHPEEVSKSWYHCAECKIYFPTKSYLSAHNSKTHKMEKLPKNLSCHFCPMKFSKNNRMFQHINCKHKETLIASGWVKCEECNQYLPDKVTLIRHNISNHKRKTKIQWKCQFCDATFSSRSGYFDHSRRQHKNEIESLWEKCSLCSKAFMTQSQLNMHMGRFHKETNKPSEAKTNGPKSASAACQWCPKTYEGAGAIRSFYLHANAYHLEELQSVWLQCDICLKYFPSKSALGSHKGQHTHEMQQIGKPVDHQIDVKCNYCSVTFENPSLLYEHAFKDHTDLVEKNWLKCSNCEQYFPTESSLHQHRLEFHISSEDLKKMTANFSCLYCSKKFLRTKEYYDHAKLVHPDRVSDEWFPCSRCKSIFPTEHLKRLHESSKHKVKPKHSKYRCEYCPMVFNHSYNYILHAEKEHQTSIAHDWIPCDLCSQYFPNSTLLSFHKATHKQPEVTYQPLKCTFCSEVYFTAKHLYEHTSKEHTAQAKKEHWKLCRQCKVYFPDEEILLSHNHLDYDYNVTKLERIGCTICRPQKVFKSLKLITDHVRKYHKSRVKKWYHCAICDSDVHSSKILRSHNIQIHKIYTCIHCLKNFSTFNLYIEHVNFKHSIFGAKFWIQCKDCQFYFPKKSNAQDHSCHEFQEIQMPSKRSSEEDSSSDENEEIPVRSSRRKSKPKKSFSEDEDKPLKLFKRNKKTVSRSEDEIPLKSFKRNVKNASNSVNKLTRSSKRKSRKISWSEEEEDQPVKPSKRRKKSRRSLTPSETSDEDNLDNEISVNPIGTKSKRNQRKDAVADKIVNTIEHAKELEDEMGLKSDQVNLAMKSGTARHVCSECQIYLPSRKELQKHLNNHHLPEVPLSTAADAIENTPESEQETKTQNEFNVVKGPTEEGSQKVSNKCDKDGIVLDLVEQIDQHCCDTTADPDQPDNLVPQPDLEVQDPLNISTSHGDPLLLLEDLPQCSDKLKSVENESLGQIGSNIPHHLISLWHECDYCHLYFKTLLALVEHQEFCHNHHHQTVDDTTSNHVLIEDHSHVIPFSEISQSRSKMAVKDVTDNFVGLPEHSEEVFHSDSSFVRGGLFPHLPTGGVGGEFVPAMVGRTNDVESVIKTENSDTPS